MITSNCKTGCENVSTLTYQWNLFMFFQASPNDVQEKWIPYTNLTYVKGIRNSYNNYITINTNYFKNKINKGTDTSELTIGAEVFNSNPNVFRWKAQFSLLAVSKQNGIGNGASSLILQLNKIPYNGSCEISPDTGTSFSTIFKFKCQNWIDDDGFIVKYVFYAKLEGNPIESIIGFSKDGNFETEMPQGSDEDDFQMSLSVKVIDNDDGQNFYYFDDKIKSEPNMSAMGNLFDSLSGSGDISNAAKLFSGNPQQVTQNLASIAAALNTDAKLSNSSSNGDYNYDFNNLKCKFYEFYNKETSTDDQETARAKRSAVRDALINFVNSISISDVNSVQAQSSMLTQLTGNTAELSRDGTVIIFKI